MAKKKGYSDRYLQAFWRKAVLSYNGNFCFMCGKYKKAEQLECHHIIKRRHRVTKHDYRNGIPLCTECHKIAHTKKGEMYIAKNHEFYNDIIELETKTVKDYLIEHGLVKHELETLELNKLKAIIKEYNGG